MEFGDERAPVGDGAKVGVEDGEVEGTVSVGTPRRVDEGGAGEVDGAVAHALDVIERAIVAAEETLDITAMPELVRLWEFKEAKSLADLLLTSLRDEKRGGQEYSR